MQFSISDRRVGVERESAPREFLPAKKCFPHIRTNQESADPRSRHRQRGTSAPITCVYCLKPCDNPTEDHIFPEAWYPDDFPRDLQKPTAPACGDCNGSHGRNERILLQRLGMHFSLDDPRAKGIGRKAARAIDPGAAKTEKDRLHRALGHKALGRAMMNVSEIGPDTRVVSGFGPHSDPGQRSKIAIQIPPDAMRTFAEKLARGFTWCRLLQTLSPEFEFHFWNPNAEQEAAVVEIASGLLANAPAGVDVLNRAPAIMVFRFADPSDPLPAFFIFEIWSGTWKLFVEVRRKAQKT